MWVTCTCKFGNLDKKLVITIRPRNISATQVWTFQVSVCVVEHVIYTTHLVYILRRLVLASQLRLCCMAMVSCIRIGGHVVLLSGSTVYYLSCASSCNSMLIATVIYSQYEFCVLFIRLVPNSIEINFHTFYFL